jgi:hypothetical protein
MPESSDISGDNEGRRFLAGLVGAYVAAELERTASSEDSATHSIKCVTYPADFTERYSG